MQSSEWDDKAALGVLRAVIDPGDSAGFKNQLVDCIQWKILKNKIRGRVLDYGCGTGRFYSRMIGMGCDYEGIDSSGAMIVEAKKINTEGATHFFQINGLQIPYPDASFDTVMSCGVFQNIVGDPDDKIVLDEVIRVLKPGGRFILIEQASLSNKKSGLALRVLTEADYRQFLSGRFDIKVLHRARACSFLRFTRIVLNVSKMIHYFPKGLMFFLADLELNRIQRSSDNSLKKMDYYDIFIEAELK